MNRPHRILFAGLFHETHTFVEGATGLPDFTILRGEEMLRCEKDGSPLGGALETAREFDWTVLPTVDFRAAPGPIVADEVIETFWSEFKTFAEPELARGINGIYLVLHGAMVSQSCLDVEGEILERIRELPGAKEIPIFGVFDLHANFTERMANHANCLVAYRENPHTDAHQAACHAATLLERCLQTGKTPRTFWQHPPIIWPPTGTATASEPMLSLESFARQIEAEAPDIWCANVIAGFSFADIPETGVSFTICTTRSETEARQGLDQLCQLAWENRAKGNVIEPPIESVMEQLVSCSSRREEAQTSEPEISQSRLTSAATGFEARPIILVEPSDNIGGGAPGDGTGVLRALIDHKIQNAAVCINDPESVTELQSLPLGGQTTLSIGGKGSRLDAGPLSLNVELISRSDGKFELEDKQSHLASMSGDHFDMGSCAVVKHDGIFILLTSNKTPPFDLAQWRSQGIEPTQLSVIGVKAAVAHRRAYDPIAGQMLWVDTPGPCSSNLKTLPYRNVKRPVYPLDDF